MPTGHATCIGSAHFNPDTFFTKWSDNTSQPPTTPSNDLRTSIISSFDLPPNDTYIYHATASVTLPQVQTAIAAGSQHGLHAWYTSATQTSAPPPPSTSDIDAYTSIFASTTATDKSLKAFASNARKGSIRARVADNLCGKRLFLVDVTVPKLKKRHVNPYLDFWAWSCQALEWCGPDSTTGELKQSHHVLPVFYHHFGCVVPSFETLEALRQFARGRAVIDAGSGNGYWSYLLRRTGMEVTAVDNGDSVWRTMWVGDTVTMDAGKYIKKRDGAAEAVLLMVYPQVTTEFTRDVVSAYKGDTVCVAGTQNGNAFTADVTALLKEGDGWLKVVQTPLPSFAGKDDAFYIWRKTTWSE